MNFFDRLYLFPEFMIIGIVLFCLVVLSILGSIVWLMKISEIHAMKKWRNNFQQNEEKVMSLFDEALGNSQKPISKSTGIQRDILTQGISHSMQLGKNIADRIAALGIQKGLQSSTTEMENVIKDIDANLELEEQVYQEQVQASLTSDQPTTTTTDTPLPETNDIPVDNLTNVNQFVHVSQVQEAEFVKAQLQKYPCVPPQFASSSLDVAGEWEFHSLPSGLISTLKQIFRSKANRSDATDTEKRIDAFLQKL